MKRYFRKSNNKHKSLILSSLLLVTLFMAAGYSLLVKEINISGEANLYSSQKYLWHRIINEYDSTHNGSFYENEYESNKYSYIGNSNNNYIELDNSLWRIVSVESDHTIKVVKISNDTSKDIKKEFDTANNRDSSSTYCLTPNYGCNSWSSQISFNNESVENDSSLLT